MPNINHLWAKLIVEELVRLGIQHFFVAPGSRSTPLVVAAGNHPNTNVTVHFDERGTAFAALGFGKANMRPAVWITTSGTAVANGLPAVVEASADGTPLLLLTADRPPELRRTGANQTIDQPGIFGSFVRWKFDMPAPSVKISPAFVLTTVDQAVQQTIGVPAGPVHLNCMFREPLEPSQGGESFDDYLQDIGRWIGADAPYTQYASSAPAISPASIDLICIALGGIERGVVVAGRLNSFEEADAVATVARKLRWPMLADIASQARLGSEYADIGISGYNLLLQESIWPQELDAVLHFGRRSTSKRLLAWIESTAPGIYAVISNHPERIDPTHQVTHRYKTSPIDFAEALIPKLPDRDQNLWFDQWRHAEKRAGAVVSSIIDTSVELNEPLVARLISRLIPAEHGLFAASSMPVRDLDEFATNEGSRAKVTANRGASGIDGSIATAFGFSTSLNNPITALMGDLAFLHDLNSLAMLRDAAHPLVLVVVNNNGGGIFSFLPISSYTDVFEPYFGTPHDIRFKAAAEIFGLNYGSPTTPTQFEEVYRMALDAPRSTILEVFTEREENHVLHSTISRRILESLQ